MITEKEASGAVARMAAMKFFPADDFIRVEIARVLLRIVSSATQLDWLVSEMINSVREWPGPYELRAVFCTKYKPADGIEAWSAIPGYTPDELEMARIESAPAIPRLNAGKAPMMLAGDVLEIAPQGAPQRTALEQELRHQEASQRLASVAGIAAEPKPLYVPGTRKRTPEENAQIERETLAEVELRRQRKTA